MDKEKQAYLMPITIVSGYLGSGKTSLLLHLLKCKGDLRLGIIANDLAEINVDAKIIQKSLFFTEEDQLISLQSGSISGNLSGQLIVAVNQLTKSQAVDYILIESSGIAQPDLIAKSIARGETILGEKLKEFCRLILW